MELEAWGGGSRGNLATEFRVLGEPQGGTFPTVRGVRSCLNFPGMGQKSRILVASILHPKVKIAASSESNIKAVLHR